MKQAVRTRGIRRVHVSRSQVTYITGWLLCVFLVVQFVLKSVPALQWVTVGGILLCGGILMIRRPLLAIALLPVASLIGPITRIEIAEGANVHLGDLYLFLGTTLFLIKHGLDKPLHLGHYKWPLFFVLFFMLLSWLFSLDQIASTMTMVGITQLVIAYIMTLNVIKTRADIDTVLIAWILAVTLCSALVIVSYFRGEVLILGVDEEAQKNYAAILLSEEVLFRASFFVTGFIFPLSSVAVIIATFLLHREKQPLVLKGVFFAVLLVNLIAIAFMGNRTVIFALTVCLGLLMLWSTRSYRAVSRLFVMVAIASVVLISGNILLREFMPKAQFDLLLERLGGQESFFLRTYVWENVLHFLLDTPHALYLGLGPDVSVRLYDHPLLQRLFFGGGFQQGAVDSGYLYVILNFGIFVSIFLLAIMVSTLRNLTTSLMRKIDYLALALWLSMVNWMIMAVTQQHGISKPILFLVQVTALAELVLTRHYPLTFQTNASGHRRPGHLWSRG